MNAAPRGDTAPARLRSRRVALARLARIREERVVKIEFQLPSVAGLSRVVRVEPKKAERYEHETPEFHKYANWLHRLGKNPEDILRRVLQKIFKKQKKVGPRLESLFAAERERRRAGDVKARGYKNATRRKNLDRALRLLFPDAKIRKQVVGLALDPRVDHGPSLYRPRRGTRFLVPRKRLAT